MATMANGQKKADGLAAMGDVSTIEWTDATWNPIRGCESVSEECRFCYAAELAARFSDKGLAFEGLAKRSAKRGLPQWTGKTMFLVDRLGLPLRWRRPRRVFVTSVSDPFHPSFTNDQIAAIFGVMAASRQHTFQLLTKRPERALEWFRWVESHDVGPDFYAQREAYRLLGERFPLHPAKGTIKQWPWPLTNVHMLVSAGTQASADKFIPLLLEIPAAVRGVSCEPLLGRVDLWAFMRSPLRDQALANLGEPSIPGIDWVIVGGESGPRARACELPWISDIVDQCKRSGVPVFVKQLGAAAGTKHPKGGDPDEWPSSIRVREFPR